MKKFWLIFKHEYLRHFLRKRFILTILSIPLMIFFVLGIGIISAAFTMDKRPVGYVDLSGVFINAQPLEKKKTLFSINIEINKFDSEKQAAQAVQNEEIQAAFIISADYIKSGAVTVVVMDTLSDDADTAFRRFLLANLVTGKPEALQERLLNGPELVFHSLTEDREFHQSNFLGIIVPLLSGIILVIAINVSGGYLLQAVTEEKENRTIEIIVTSVSPNQLMAGKIMGNLSVGLTQLVAWALTGAGGVVLAMRLFPEASGSGLDLSFLGLMLITFLPAFVMIAALMAMLGATAAEARDAQQFSTLLSIPVVVPLWFLAVIIETPNSPIAIILSLIPFTAPATLPIRAVLTNIPVWQIILSVSLLFASAIIAVWLASRAFRLGLLRYGKSLSLREIIRRTKA